MINLKNKIFFTIEFIHYEKKYKIIINANGLNFDSNLHDRLGLKEDYYNILLKKYNGTIIEDECGYGDVYVLSTFKKRIDAIIFIEEVLEPRIVELKLTKI